MMIFAHYDSETHGLIGFYDSGVHLTIPEPSVEVSPAARAAVLAAGGAHTVDPETGAMAAIPPAAPTPAQLKTRLEGLRLAREAGGIAAGGVAVATDIRAMTLINGAVAHAAFPVKVKTSAGGFVDVDAPALSAIAGAIAAHVVSCFAAEASVAAAIEAEEIATFAALDAAWAATE